MQSFRPGTCVGYTVVVLVAALKLTVATVDLYALHIDLG